MGAPRITESRIDISAVHGEDGITFPDTGEKLTDSQRVVEGLYDYPEGNTFYAHLNFVVYIAHSRNPCRAPQRNQEFLHESSFRQDNFYSEERIDFYGKEDYCSDALSPLNLKPGAGAFKAMPRHEKFLKW